MSGEPGEMIVTDEEEGGHFLTRETCSPPKSNGGRQKVLGEKGGLFRIRRKEDVTSFGVEEKVRSALQFFA